MDTRKPIKPQRIAAQDLAQAARQGVERALAARQVMTELTPEQTTQVSGAAAAIKAPVVGVVIKKPPVVVGFLPYPGPIDPTI